MLEVVVEHLSSIVFKNIGDDCEKFDVLGKFTKNADE